MGERSMSQASNCQQGILDGVPEHGRYLWFQLEKDRVEHAKAQLEILLNNVDGQNTVVGLGKVALELLNKSVDGFDEFPAYDQHGIQVPSTPAALWVWLRGDDPGKLLHSSRSLITLLTPGFTLSHSVDGFKFDGGKDLSGYEDGTENPEGDDAVNAAFSSEGASFVAVQQWQHNLLHFESLPQQEKDHIIGRRQSDNEELDDAPVSAHVKRTAQESFEPEAFMLRRSMPWAEGQNSGLVFVCFANSTSPFKQQMARMAGEEDGITDGLFRFSQPKNGAFFWVPPMNNGKIQL